MRDILRTLALGLLAGFALSLARAPVGAVLMSVPAVTAIDAALYRALALVVIALAVSRARVLSAPPSYGLLTLGALLGFALHGLLLANRVEVGGLPTLGIALLVLGALMWAVAGGPPKTPSHGKRPDALECLGLGLGGAGAAIALESVARSLRLLGSGTPHDDTVFALSLLACMAIGGVAFGPMFAGAPKLPGLAVGLGLGALACFYSAHFLGEFSTRTELDAFLRSPPWKLDLAYVGRLQGDALIGARVLLLGGFVLGAILWGTRHRFCLASVLFGAGVGLFCLNAFLIDPTPEPVRVLGLRAAERIALGATLAGFGGILALLGARDRHPRPAVIAGILVCLVVIGYARFGHRPAALPISPWENFPVEPVWTADTPEGFLTVEPGKEGELVLTLDRRRLTPDALEGLADQHRIASAWELLPEDERAGCRVLLIGQLTPTRAFVLRSLGAARVDRTAAWHRSMPAIEAALFAGSPIPSGEQGEVLAPLEAERRLQKGQYELVIAPPTEPRGSRAPGPPPEGYPPVVSWLYTHGNLVHRDLGERVLLSGDGFEYLSIGVHHGEQGLPSGAPAPGRTPLEILLAWPFDRARDFQRSLGERLAGAGADDPAGSGGKADLAKGLALHLAAQERSSPWETVAEGTELDGEALKHLRLAMLAAEPSGPEYFYLRSLWTGASRTLVEKREIDLIYEHLEPLAEALAPWPKLERALAHADFEMLDPASAAERLRKVLREEPYDLSAMIALGHALEMAGDPAAAAVEFERALAIQPDRRDIRRRLAVALVRGGDPRGPELVDELLAEDPEDDGLRVYAGGGPFPPLEAGFTPFSSFDDHGDEHGDGHSGHAHDR